MNSLFKSMLALGALGVLAGCGNVRDNNPLAGLGGSTDTARFNFENSAQSWAPSASQGGTCSGVSQSNGLSFMGKYCLAVSIIGMGNHYMAGSGGGGSCPSGSSTDPCPGPDDAARACIVYASGYPDLTGATIKAWVYMPGSGQPNTNAPTQAQIYLVENTGSNYSNGPGVNLRPDNWTLVTFSPVANPSACALSQGGAYFAAGFSPSDIKEIGLKFAASGSAGCSFQFTGTFLIDSVNW